MNTTLIGVVAAGFVVTLTGCVTAEKKTQDQGYAPLSQAELEQTYARTRTVAWSNPAGSKGTATYETDGSARVSWQGGEDEGRWRIVDGRFCSKWKTVRNGVENCTKSYKVGENEYRAYNVDGTLSSILSFTD